MCFQTVHLQINLNVYEKSVYLNEHYKFIIGISESYQSKIDYWSHMYYIHFWVSIYFT